MKFLGLSFLLGLVSATGFQPLGLWPLTILAFTGLLLLIEQRPVHALGAGAGLVVRDGPVRARA